MCRPSQTPHPTMSSARIGRREAGLGSKKRGDAPPPSEAAVRRPGKVPEGTLPVRPPAGTRRPALAAGAARAVHRQPTGSGPGPPCPALGANPFPEVTDPFCRLPLPTLFHRPEAVHLGDPMRVAGGAPDTTRRAVLFQPLDPTSG
ncbi:unnamed protein product [Prunus brigantina]